MGFARPHEAGFECGRVGEVACGQDNAATRVEHPLACRGLRLHAHHDLALTAEVLHMDVGAKVHARSARATREVVDEGPRIGQHIVHARLAVRRLGHGAHEAHAGVEQPLESFGHLIAEDAPQAGVVARVQVARESGHVFPVVERIVRNAFAALMGGTRSGDRANGPRGGAAELRVLLE